MDNESRNMYSSATKNEFGTTNIVVSGSRMFRCDEIGYINHRWV
jgi:hypothetical protein